MEGAQCRSANQPDERHRGSAPCHVPHLLLDRGHRKQLKGKRSPLLGQGGVAAPIKKMPRSLPGSRFAPRIQRNGTIYLMARPPLLCQGVDFAFPAGSQTPDVHQGSSSANQEEAPSLHLQQYDPKGTARCSAPRVWYRAPVVLAIEMFSDTGLLRTA